MARRLTRREAIAGFGSAVAFGAGASTVGGDRPDEIVERELDGDYPRCVYKRDDDGDWRVSMPINVRVRVPGGRSALAVVEEEFRGLSNLEWTRRLPDSPTRAWDDRREELVEPALSVRRPRLGDEWNHVHVWPIDADRAAVHAHLDVLDLTASHFHRGDRYRDAAAAVSDHFATDRWRRVSPYSIDYGVDSSRLERWGPTGDRKLEFEGESEGEAESVSEREAV